MDTTQPSPLDQYLQAQQAPEESPIGAPEEAAPAEVPNQEPEAMVPVFDPTTNKVGHVPSWKLPSYLSQGYTPATPDQVAQNEMTGGADFGDIPHQIVSGLDALANAATFGGYTAALKASDYLTGGHALAEVKAGEEANPGTHIAGELAAFANPWTGTAKLLGKTGTAAADIVAPYMPEILARVGPTAVSGFVQGSMISGGNEVSKLIREDPGTSAETALIHTGLGGLLGAGTNLAAEGLSNLWSSKFGGYANQFVADARNRFQEYLDNPDPASRMAEELQHRYNTDKEIFDDVYGSKGLKAEAQQKLLPNQLSDTMVKQAQDTLSKASQISQEMGMIENQDLYPRSSMALFNKNVRILNNALEKPSAPGQIFDALQDFKQRLQDSVGYGNGYIATKADKPFEDLIKPFASEVRGSLENADVWGKAGEIQQNINKAWREYAGGKTAPLKQFETKFTTNVNGDRQIDLGKVQTYLNQTGKSAQEIRQKMLGNWLDSSDKYRDAINDMHSKLGVESPFEPSSLTFTKSTLGKQTMGAKFADAVVKKGLAQTVGRTIGAGVGGGLGHLVGAPGFGALIGEHTLGPLFEGVLPALTRPFLGAPVNAVGAKAAINYGMNVTKGEKAIDDAVDSVFKK